MRSIYLLPLCLLACGDDDTPNRPDGAVQPMDDSGVDIDASTVIPCGFTEAADATNDFLFGNAGSDVPEPTSISFSTATAICGKFNNGHYNSTAMAVDVDSYTFTVAAGTRGILHLTAPGAENFDSVLVEIFADQAPVSEYGQFVGNHATLSVELPADTYYVVVSAYDAQDPAAALDYKLTLEVDAASRCAKSTAAAAFTEAGEGNAATGGGNDVLEVRYGGQPRRQVTALATDMPEATNVTVAPGQTYRVSGVNSTFTATPVSWMDSFQDRDTYAITMGPNTNQLSIRLNWPGTTGDFDFFVFPANGVLEQAVGWDNGNMEDEFTTLAVTPGATYWVWVGLDDASTGQPINYDLTLCGDTFTP